MRDNKERARRRLTALAVAAVFIVGSGLPAGEPAVELDGLVAWYAIDSLHPTHNDGDFVTGWPDSAADGRHLGAESGSVAAVFETMRLNDEPVVRIRGRSAFGVERPFELDDHTIVLVFGSHSKRRALFFDDEDDRNGVVLLDEGGYHHIQVGEPERLAPYNGSPVPRDGFRIVVLTRQSGVLGCSVDGVDLSSRVQFEDPLRVGGFFRLRTKTGQQLEGAGLQITEMIFYNRHLSESETGAVTSYLSEKYGIGVETALVAKPVEPPLPPFLPPRSSAQVWLETREFTEVNALAVYIPWETQAKLEPPFQHDPDGDDTRLVCTRDGTRAELFVQLPLKTSARGAAVRLLILKNGDEYLPVQAESGPIRGKNPKQATIQLTTTVEMNAGDYFEVIAAGSGAPGVVVVDPYHAALVVRAE